MNSRRPNISILLMILAISAIISFQSYWVYKNYKEEKQGLRVQTNILFREAVYQCQATKMKMDSSVKFRRPFTGKIKLISKMQDRTHDSIRQRSAYNTVIFRNEKQRLPVLKDSTYMEVDSFKIKKFISTSPGDAKVFIEMLEEAEGFKDSITVKELQDEYRTTLLRENMDLPFTITRSQADMQDEIEPPDMEQANEVTIGLLNPVTFRIDIANTTGFILRKMFPIILVSVLLVAVTVLSFVLLLRNFMRQRKLIQIKNDFISNITHELKTPIATVSVAIEAMKNFNVLDDPQRTQEYLNISSNELQRLSLLVDKVLRLSMFEKKEIDFKKESFDVGTLTREVMDSMKLQFEKHHALASMKLTGENFIIEADRRHIASVIYNLFDNALKYSHTDPVINVDIIDQSGFLELRVSDNGIGIPEEYRDKIFEQFFRVPSGDKHNIKGYGLGLSYVNHIVKSHMGFIELETHVGRGSTFIVKLPFAEAPVIYYDRNRQIRKIKFKL